MTARPRNVVPTRWSVSVRLRSLGARRLVSVPSALAYAPLRLLESAGLPLRFRSDSLVSLLNPNPRVDWSAHARLGLRYHPFA